MAPTVPGDVVVPFIALRGSVSIVGDTFKLNKAGGDALGYGGAVFAVHAVTASTNTFTGNIAYGSASGAFAYGGAVYAQGDFSMNGGSFAQNSASGGSVSAFGYSYGGALDVEAGFNLTTVSFMDNVATGGAGGSAQGGAIFVNGGSNTWNAVTLSGNGSTSTGQLSYSAGGAVVAFAPLTMTGALVTGNTTSASSAGLAGAGGGLAVEASPFAFRGTISGNKATTQGGGIWLGGAATVTQSTIASNGVVGTENPNDGGGGIYDDIGGSLVLQTSTVSGNTVGGNVAASGGGGIFNAGSATISNATISSNSSAIDGGGAENEAQSGFSLTNVTIYQNAAAHGNGGNIKNLFSDAGLSIANSIVAGGSAMIGADISNDGSDNIARLQYLPDRYKRNFGNRDHDAQSPDKPAASGTVKQRRPHTNECRPSDKSGNRLHPVFCLQRGWNHDGPTRGSQGCEGFLRCGRVRVLTCPLSDCESRKACRIVVRDRSGRKVVTYERPSSQLKIDSLTSAV